MTFCCLRQLDVPLVLPSADQVFLKPATTATVHCHTHLFHLSHPFYDYIAANTKLSQTKNIYKLNIKINSMKIVEISTMKNCIGSGDIGTTNPISGYICITIFAWFILPPFQHEMGQTPGFPNEQHTSHKVCSTPAVVVQIAVTVNCCHHRDHKQKIIVTSTL